MVQKQSDKDHTLFAEGELILITIPHPTLFLYILSENNRVNCLNILNLDTYVR